MHQSNLSLYVSRFPARWSNRPRLEGRGFGLPRTAGRFGATLGVGVGIGIGIESESMVAILFLNKPRFSMPIPIPMATPTPRILRSWSCGRW